MPTWTRVLLRVCAAFAVSAFACASAYAADWPQFGRTPRHLNTNPAETAFSAANISGLQVVWKAHFGNNVATEGGPVIAGSRLFVAGFDGRLSAFDMAGCGAASCEPLWQGRARNDFTSTPAVVDGRVYVASADHFLYVFDAAGCAAATCPPLWRGQLQDGSIDSSVAVVNGMAFVGDYSGHLYAFDANGCAMSTCAPLWVGIAGPNEQLLSAPAVADGHVFIASTISTPEDMTGRLLVYAIGGCDAQPCAPEWTADLGGPAGRTASPLIANGTFYVGSSRRFGGPNTSDHLFAFPTAGCGAAVCTASQVFDVGPDGIETALALSGGRLFASTNTSPRPNRVGVVAAFNLAGCGARCKPAWTGVNSTEGFVSPPVVAGDMVFVGKGPASGINIDSGVFAYDVRGCGARVCEALTLVVPGPDQNYPGAPLAIGQGRIAFVSNDNSDGHSNVVIMALP
jgi:outer membrane protein assembly factor BamB